MHRGHATRDERGHESHTVFVIKAVKHIISISSRRRLTIDIAATLDRHRRRTADPEALIDREVTFLREVGSDLVVAETAPIALKIAYRAGLPSGLATNFDWHWLSRALARTEPALMPLADPAHAAPHGSCRAVRK